MAGAHGPGGFTDKPNGPAQNVTEPPRGIIALVDADTGPLLDIDTGGVGGVRDDLRGQVVHAGSAEDERGPGTPGPDRRHPRHLSLPDHLPVRPDNGEQPILTQPGHGDLGMIHHDPGTALDRITRQRGNMCHTTKVPGGCANPQTVSPGGVRVRGRRG